MAVRFPCLFELSDLDPLVRRYSPARITQRQENNETIFDFEVLLGTATNKSDFPEKLNEARSEIIAAWLFEKFSGKHYLHLSQNIQISINNHRLAILFRFASKFEVSLAQAFLAELTNLEDRFTPLVVECSDFHLYFKAAEQREFIASGFYEIGQSTDFKKLINSIDSVPSQVLKGKVFASCKLAQAVNEIRVDYQQARSG